MYGYELTLQEFFWTYRPFALFEEVGFFSLFDWYGRKITDKCPSSNKGWKAKFFYVSTLGFCKETLMVIACVTARSSKIKEK